MSRAASGCETPAQETGHWRFGSPLSMHVFQATSGSLLPTSQPPSPHAPASQVHTKRSSASYHRNWPRSYGLELMNVMLAAS